MKKILLFIYISIFSVISLTAKENFLSFSMGVSTGYINYSSGLMNYENAITNITGQRFIIGGTAYVNLSFSEQLSVYLNSDVLYDFNHNSISFNNHLDYSYGLGVKIYPKLKGLAFCFGYSLGTRNDYYQNYDTGYLAFSEGWSNGLRLAIEYNFSHEKTAIYLPTVGFYWRYMPRSFNEVDNVLGTYILLNF